MKTGNKPWVIWRTDAAGRRVVANRFRSERAARAELRKLNAIAYPRGCQAFRFSLEGPPAGGPDDAA